MGVLTISHIALSRRGKTSKGKQRKIQEKGDNMPLIRLNNEDQGLVSGLIQDVRYLVKGDMQAFIENDRSIQAHLIHYDFEEVLRDVPPGRNTLVFVSPDEWVLPQSLVWNKDLLHLVGVQPQNESFQKVAITHAINMSPLVTFSGNYCRVSNINFKYGVDDALNENAVLVSGDNNVFEYCHFNGPVEDAEAADADFIALMLSGENNIFKNCTIGADLADRAEANTLLQIMDGANGNIFENCTFLSVSSAASPFYVRVDSGVTGGKTTFRNCVATNESTNWATDLTLAIDFQPANTAHRLIMDNSMFANAVDVVADGKEAALLYNSFHAADGVLVGLPVIPDHT